MAFKLLVALALCAVAAVSAGFIPAAQHVTYHGAGSSAPVYHAHHYAAEPYDHHPQYQFSYGVDDKLTGDSKSHYEQRDGDVVRGEYSLIDADGYKRIVRYTADDVNGFNAVVERIPLVHSHPVYHSAPTALYHH